MDTYTRTCEYLRDAMKLYWPTATQIDVREDSEEEMWYIDVHHPHGKIEYFMEIGSDDSWFTFHDREVSSPGSFSHSYEGVLTFPFPDFLNSED